MSDQVKFGADAQEYFDVVARMEERLDQLAKKAGHSGGRFGEGHEGILRNEHRVAHALGSVSAEIAGTGSAAQIASASLLGLGSALALPLGAIAGFVVAGEVIGKVAEHARNANAAVKGLERDISKNPLGAFENASPEKISERIGAEHEKFKDAIAKVGSFHPGKQDELRHEEILRRHRLELAAGDRASDGTDIARAAAFKSSSEAARLKAIDDSHARRAQITLNPDLDPKAKFGQINEEKKQLEIQLAVLERVAAAKQRDYDLTLRIAGIRRQGGDDIEVDSARAKQVSAINDLVAARNADERRAATERIANATTELKVAERLRDIARENFRLAGERRDISRDATKRSISASPADRERIDLKARMDEAFAANKSAQEQLAKANKGGTATDSDRNQAADTYVAAQEAAVKLNIYDQERAFNEKQTLTAAQATTTEMGLQATGQDHLATLAGIRATYEEKIAQHHHDQRTDLEAQDRIQQHLATLKENAKELGKTGPQKYQEYLNQLEKTRNFNTAAAQEKDAADRASRGSVSAVHSNDKHDFSAFDKAFHKPLKDAADRGIDANGKAEAPKTDPVIGKMETLIQTLNALPAKIGIV